MKYFKIIDSSKYDESVKKYFVGQIKANEGKLISFRQARDVFFDIDKGSWILEVEPISEVTERNGVYYAEEIEVVRMMRLDKVPAYQMLSKEHADFTVNNNAVLKCALLNYPGVFNFLVKHWDRLSAGKRV